MEVVLIACAKGKVKGGLQRSSARKDGFVEDASEATKVLMRARRGLAEQLKCHPGEDLGFTETTASLRFLPAHKRYSGQLYLTSQLAAQYPTPGVRVLIISALYGLLDAAEPIRWYELPLWGSPRFSAKPQDWWREQVLGAIVEARIQSLEPTTVHDLLSGPYRSVLGRWPPSSLEPIYRAFEPPPGALNANTLRGRRLHDILNTRRQWKGP